MIAVVSSGAVVATLIAKLKCLSRGCIHYRKSSNTGDDCKRSSGESNSCCCVLSDGTFGGVGVVGHWFEVLWRSSLLDLFTISVPAGNHLTHSRDLFSGVHPPSG